jgi:hypothetical protein
VHKVFFDLIPTVQRSKEIFIIEFAMVIHPANKKYHSNIVGFWLSQLYFLALYIYVSVSGGNQPTSGNYANHDLGHWIPIQWTRREMGSFFR